MLDGEETVEIACWRELRWEGARQGAIQHAGRKGNRGNSLDRGFAGRERDSMLDGEETVEITAFLGRSETACWTERKPCK